jgi:hypothetical protein
MDYIRQHAVCHSVLESSCPPLHSSLFPRTSMAMQIANFFFSRVLISSLQLHQPSWDPQGEGDWRSLAKVAFGMGPSTLSALSLRILPEND